jgi:predicted dehydrogenase
MNGAHYFEMFRFMTDETPSTVQAWFDKDKIANPRGPEFEDRSGCVRLTTPSGKRFHMDCSANQGHGLHVSYATHNGRIDVDELAGRMTSSVRKTEHRDEPTTRYGTPWDEDSQTIAPADAVAPSRAVLESLLGNGDYPDGQIGRMAVEILVAAHQSNDEDGRVVELARTPLPRDRIFSWA